MNLSQQNPSLKIKFPILLQNPEPKFDSQKQDSKINLKVIQEIAEKHQNIAYPESTVSQEKIQEIMSSGNLADITLVGYVIKLLRNHNRMSFKEISDEVSKCYGTLRRSDGSKYEGDMIKALRGCLTSSSIFQEIGNDTWTIRESQAKIYEGNATKKLKTLLTRKKKKDRTKRADISAEEEKDDSNQSHANTENNAQNIPIIEREKKKIKKVKRPLNKYQQLYDILDISCKVFKEGSGTNYLMKNPFKGIKGNENTQELWQKLGSEKFVGILQCFDYFSPIIGEYLKEAQKKTKTSKSIENISMLKANLAELAKQVGTLEKQLKNNNQGDNNQ